MFKLAPVAALSVAFSGAALAADVTVAVETGPAEGTLRAALFDSQQGFDADKSVANMVVDVVAGTTRFRFADLEPGIYGVALFHDLNGNEELDSNLFGAPVEPFGFSNNPEIGFSAPGFAAFNFEVESAPVALNISLVGG